MFLLFFASCLLLLLLLLLLAAADRTFLIHKRERISDFNRGERAAKAADTDSSPSGTSATSDSGTRSRHATRRGFKCQQGRANGRGNSGPGRGGVAERSQGGPKRKKNGRGVRRARRVSGGPEGARVGGGVAEGGGGGKSEGISESCKESCKER